MKEVLHNHDLDCEKALNYLYRQLIDLNEISDNIKEDYFLKLNDNQKYYQSQEFYKYRENYQKISHLIDKFYLENKFCTEAMNGKLEGDSLNHLQGLINNAYEINIDHIYNVATNHEQENIFVENNQNIEVNASSYSTTLFSYVMNLITTFIYSFGLYASPSAPILPENNLVNSSNQSIFQDEVTLVQIGNLNFVDTDAVTEHY